MNPLSFKRILLRYGPAVAMTALIPALSLLPAHFFRGVESSLPPIRGFDKIVHALMYAALTAAYLHALPLSKQTRAPSVLQIALTAILYGALMELCQNWLTTTRCMDPFDALANAAGAFACALAAYVWAQSKKNSSGQRPAAGPNAR